MSKYFATFVCLILTFLLVPPISLAAMDGLVGAWLFEEGSGETVEDASGNGHDALLIGAATWTGDGPFGSAVMTDGSEAYVEIADHDDFEFDGDFSLACWVQNDQAPPDHSAFMTKGYHLTAANGGDAKPWYLVYFLTTGTVDMFLRDEAGTNSRASGVTPVNDGEWHHLVAMRAGDEVKLYIDGQEDASAPAVDATYGGNDSPLVFMAHYERWFPGMIDEAAVFNRALSDNEIESMMSNGLSSALAVDPRGKVAVCWGDLKPQ